ncbi:MAG: hypothetical protein U1F98_07870 [Verrucomicrobiota bacterium]
MKRNFIGLVTGAWLALGASIAHAQDTALTLSFQLTARGFTTNWSGNVFKAKTYTGKVDTKIILGLLGDATASDFTGASLVLIFDPNSYTNSNVFQVRRGTNIVADVSSFFTITSGENDVYSETYDGNTGKDSYQGYWIQSLAFDDKNGHSFNLNGVTQETYNASAANKTTYIRKISESQKYTASGDGDDSGDYYIFTGTVSAKGGWTDTW